MLEVLYEDNHIIAVNKKCGDIVQGDKTGDKTLADDVKAYIKKKYNKPGDVFIGIPHRLDRPTSGIVIFTRTSKALSRMNKIFADKEIEKHYLVVVDKMPLKNADTITHFLFRNTKQNKSYAYDEARADSKEAVLSYKFIGKSDKYFLLNINLLTGRHHQIRAQLAEINCFIKGDLKYGFKRSNKNGGIHLHSYTAKFIHPVSLEIINIKAMPPKDPVWDFFVNNKLI